MLTKIKFHFDVYDDLLVLKNDAYDEFKEIMEDLKNNPFLGIPLENRPDLDIYLSGYRKIYFFKKQLRIVYSVSKNGDILIYLLAVGQRDKLEVYKTASGRINE